MIRKSILTVHHGSCHVFSAQNPASVSSQTLQE